MYAQKIEGDEWLGDKIDQGKMQKMSGESLSLSYSLDAYLYAHAHHHQTSRLLSFTS